MLVAGFTQDYDYCSVYSSKFLDMVVGQNDRLKNTINRCRQVQDCVKEALYSDNNNLYVINKAFMSTVSRPPVELIVKYNVTIIANNDIEDGAHNVTSHGYMVEFGWSKIGIHTLIRSTVIASLQPAVYRWILSHAIGSYGFPKLIHLEINITTPKCYELMNANYVEVREALKYLTTKVRSYQKCIIDSRSLIFRKGCVHDLCR